MADISIPPPSQSRNALLHMKSELIPIQYVELQSIPFFRLMLLGLCISVNSNFASSFVPSNVFIFYPSIIDI